MQGTCKGSLFLDFKFFFFFIPVCSICYRCNLKKNLRCGRKFFWFFSSHVRIFSPDLVLHSLLLMSRLLHDLLLSFQPRWRSLRASGVFFILWKSSLSQIMTKPKVFGEKNNLVKINGPTPHFRLDIKGLILFLVSWSKLARPSPVDVLRDTLAAVTSVIESR